MECVCGRGLVAVRLVETSQRNLVLLLGQHGSSIETTMHRPGSVWLTLTPPARKFYFEGTKDHTIHGRSSTLDDLKAKALAYAKRYNVFVDVYEHFDSKDYMLGMFRNEDDGNGWFWSPV